MGQTGKKLSSNRVAPLSDSYTTDTVEGILDSPLLPMQQTLKLRFGVTERRDEKGRGQGVDSDSMSEMSQPLIPLIQPGTVDTRTQKSWENKEADIIEPSQSLLPQSHSEKTQLLAHLGLCRSTPPSTPKHSAVDSDKDTTIGCENRSLSQKSNKGDYCQLGSQREITQSHQLDSQREKTQSQASLSSTDKINARLERLLESLSSAPRKQKRVTEIAVSQCIGKIQDNLHNKFKNKNINPEQQAMLKAHLQTTQSCLAKLLNHYKTEKADMASSIATRSPSTQHTKKATLAELALRQKELHNLLKRQKSLVDRFKEIVRLQSSTNQPTKLSDTCTDRAVSQPKPAETSRAGNLDGEPAPVFDNSINYPSQVFTSMQQDLDNIDLSGTNTSSKITTQESKTTSNLEKNKGCTVTAAETENHIQDNFDMSQDVTTIPDTQEVQSQLTDKQTDENVITEDDNTKLEARQNNTEIKEMSVNTHNVKVAPLKSSRVPKRNVPWSPEQEAEKKTKKGKSNATSGHAAIPSAINIDTPEPASFSEMLWLNMLHKTTDNVLVAEKLPHEATGKRATAGEILQTKANQRTGCDKEILHRNYSTNIQRNLVKDSDAETLIVDEPSGNVNTCSTSEKPIATERPNTDNALYSKTMTPEVESKRLNRKTMVPEVECKRLGFSCTSKVTDFKQPDCFTSPQPRCLDADVYTDISPTATSMSSDVFLVKAKELQKRMKMREKLAESNAKCPKPPQPTADLTGTNQTVSTRKAEVEGMRKTDRDTISEAIDSVIAKSRYTSQVIATPIHHMNISQSKNVSEGISHKQPSIFCDPKTVSSGIHSHGAAGKEQQFVMYNTDRNGTEAPAETRTGKIKETTSGLPTLKQLVHAGVMSPGRNVLSLLSKGSLHKATITPLGKIRTSEGLVFNTPMQWLSTMTDGEIKKKRSTYTQILYKGRSMLEMCRYQQHKEGSERNSEDKRPPNFQNDIHATSEADKYAYPVKNPVGISEKCVQTDVLNGQPVSGLAGYQGEMTADGKQLNHILSTSKIRLLTDSDLVSCEDLPDNFWAEDYSKVKLSIEIWETVDKW